MMAVKTSEITLAQAFLAPFGMWWSVVEREEKIELHSGKVVKGRVWVDSDEGGSLEVEWLLRQRPRLPGKHLPHGLPALTQEQFLQTAISRQNLITTKMNNNNNKYKLTNTQMAIHIVIIGKL